MEDYKKLEELYLNNRFTRDSSTIKDPMTVIVTLTDFNDRGEDDRTLLHLAVENTDLEGVKFLLEKEVDLDADANDNTLLHTLANAAFARNYKDIVAHQDAIYEIAKLLLEHKVKPKRKNNYDHIAYVVAAEKMNFPMLKALAESGLKMDAPKENGMNLMHFLLERNEGASLDEFRKACLVGAIDALINSGLDPEDKDAFGYNVEHYARRGDFRDIIALLTGDESASQHGGMSLVEAITKKEYEIADSLLENGADINEVDSERKMTPLMWFCAYPNPEAVEYLVKKGADVNFSEGETQYTAMGLLITSGYNNLRGLYLDSLFKMYKTLCKSKLDIDAVVDGKGNTALNLLCAQRDMEGSNTKIAEILIDKGADVNIANLEGATPLISFAKHNGKELSLGICELLIDEDADVTYTDRYGNNVVMYAAQLYSEGDAKKICELALEVDGDIANAVNNEGKTAMDYAVERGNEACVKALIMYMN